MNKNNYASDNFGAAGNFGGDNNADAAGINKNKDVDASFDGVAASQMDKST